MKKITVISGNNFKDVNNYAIKLINYKDLTCQNFIIVPDRLSLIMEKQVFKSLNISATLNIQVMGISRLSNFIFNKLGLENEFVNKQESVLFVRKAILNLKNKLNFFNKKISMGICEEIYNTIAQLKANEIMPEDLSLIQENLSALHINQISDIIAIFEEYEKLLDKKLDSTKILIVLKDAIKNVDLSNYNFYFLNFDSLTKQGYSVLQALVNASKNCVVGVIQPDLQRNLFIFENDIYEKLKKLSSESKNFNLEIISVPCSLNAQQLLIHKNLYSLDIQGQSENFDFLRVFEADNIYEEVFNLARQINFLIKSKKIRYDKISVACGDLPTYESFVENIFSQFGFSFYIDSNEKFTQTHTIKFLLAILNLLKKNYPLDILEEFLISDFNSLTNQEKNNLLDYALKYNLCKDDLFKNFEDSEANNLKNNVFNIFKELNQIRNNCKNGKDFVDFIILIIEKFNIVEKNQELIKNFRSKNLIKEEKIYIQIPDKLWQILSSLEKITATDNINFNQFMELFESGVESIELATVPISVNSIFVGDATNSYFEEADYLFVLGANENVIPKFLNDTGIISDDEIKSLSEYIEINPTVKMINRRNRFKIFNLLLTANKRIYISYSLMSGSRDKLLPSGFVSDLQKIFSVNGQNLAPMRTADYISLLKKQKGNTLCKNFAYFCASKQNAMNEVLKLKYENDFNKDVLSSLYEFIKPNFNEQDTETLSPEEISQLNFPNNTVTISKVENYYSCPFKQFANYALKLREKEVFEVLPFDIGNFLHKIAEEFLNPKNNYINQINSENKKLTNVVNDIIKKLKANKKFYKFNLKINQNITSILEKESIRLCEFLLYSQSVSKFKPAYLEVFFGGKDFPSYQIKVGENIFYITGIVDRIDIYNDMFIIIDYKSGSEGTGGVSELYYGDKIQIYVYFKIFEEILNKKPCGAFYFPVKNEYKEEKQKEKEYQLKGRAIDDITFLTAMDTSVNFDNQTSKIFSCKLNTNKKLVESGEKEYSKKYTISENLLSNIENHSIKMIINAIKEILEGNYLPSPRKDACNFCKFASLCGYDKKQGFRDSVYKITNDFFEIKNKNILRRLDV